MRSPITRPPAPAKSPLISKTLRSLSTPIQKQPLSGHYWDTTGVWTLLGSGDTTGVRVLFLGSRTRLVSAISRKSTLTPFTILGLLRFEWVKIWYLSHEGGFGQGVSRCSGMRKSGMMRGCEDIDDLRTHTASPDFVRAPGFEASLGTRRDGESIPFLGEIRSRLLCDAYAA